MKIKNITLSESITARSAKDKGFVLYTVDASDPKWAGWEFSVEGHLLLATPPTKYETTAIPLSRVKTICFDVPSDKPSKTK